MKGALTAFGSLSYQIHSSDTDVEATIDCPHTGGPAWLHFYLYPIEGKSITLARVNGVSEAVNNGILEIPHPSGTVHVSAEFSRAN